LTIYGVNFPKSLAIPTTVSYGGATCTPIEFTGVGTTLTCTTGIVPASTLTSGARVQVDICINKKCANNLDIGILD
jgi:hypothetical protein